MQLCANDESHQIIYAHAAVKQCDYFCLECAGTLRLRGGLHRQKHFYHLNPSQRCRQNGKSMEHLQVQCALRELIGDECLLEYPFPTIQRIADCAWLSQKIVFEVQCSFISQEEVAKRNADYASLGFATVWLLHDKRYNQKRLSAAEVWLRSHPHYFTNIAASGDGYIYDQYDIAERGWRRGLLQAMAVNLAHPYKDVNHSLPKDLQDRHSKWGLGFKGDWVQRADEEGFRQLLAEVFYSEHAPNPAASAMWRVWQRCIVTPYRIVFAYLLEKACR